MSEPAPVTRLLGDLRAGDRSALDRLMPLVYDELRRIADGRLRGERRDHTLQPTALVHEAFLRMVDQRQPDFQSRAQFFAIAGRVMRQILVDHARKAGAAKRGGEKQSLDASVEPAGQDPERMLHLDLALTRLEEQDERKARLVEMRYFGGLTAEESATITGLSVPEVRRELRVAQAWLSRDMSSNAAFQPGS
ncbi:MAG TPA: sigma-70 family RNA polymerase sigma factor [Bryobacteraceae bacterium]|jgi:RNA polymerase sigma factor (TIGR02999 family)|nr:sigma-70 family RNA polymerase sigma factor [Bryobacteraceae bacterium]